MTELYSSCYPRPGGGNPGEWQVSEKSQVLFSRQTLSPPLMAQAEAACGREGMGIGTKLQTYLSLGLKQLQFLGLDTPDLP